MARVGSGAFGGWGGRFLGLLFLGVFGFPVALGGGVFFERGTSDFPVALGGGVFFEGGTFDFRVDLGWGVFNSPLPFSPFDGETLAFGLVEMVAVCPGGFSLGGSPELRSGLGVDEASLRSSEVGRRQGRFFPGWSLPSLFGFRLLGDILGQLDCRNTELSVS